jgi:hypothetical protein
VPPAGALGLAFLLARLRGRRGRADTAGVAGALAGGTRPPAMRAAPDQTAAQAAQATPTTPTTPGLAEAATTDEAVAPDAAASDQTTPTR